MSVDIDLAVEMSADGKWIRERVPARVPDSETFELANSPMLVRGLAADDLISLDADGQFELLRWGRNVAVQVFGEWGEVDALAQHVASIGGRLDGKEPRMRVFTIPLSAGIHRIETTIDGVLTAWPKLSWMFGNLTPVDLLAGYDEAGEPVFESVHAFQHHSPEPDTAANERVFYELLASPLLVSGIASGDHLRLDDAGGFDVIARNGNVAVQTIGDWELDFLTPLASDLGGRLDGVAAGHAGVFTFPSSVDLAAIHDLFGEGAGNDPARTWRIANSHSS